MRNSWILCASVLPSMIFLLLIPEGMCERIIGGQEVTPHSRPYMALLKNNGETICAGALVGKDWVLTAAHCKMEGSRAQVILGAHSAIKNEPEKQIMAIKKKLPYPCFDNRTFEGDLQLLQLKKKPKLSNIVTILPIPKTGDDVKPGTMCHVAGWGLSENQSPSSDILKEVNITVIDRKICNDNKHYDFNPVIGLNMICAGSPKGGKDSCKGDSGSPLLCEGTVRGITSFGKEKCGNPRYPGVYTLLSQKHLDWILTTMKKAV